MYFADLFYIHVASNPFFRNDSAWKTFLNSNDSISKLKTDDSENVGENMLVSALQALVSTELKMDCF